MILSGDFFRINSLNTEEGIINAELEINAFHKIFAGHFPGHPVVPGVCMLQVVKELLESVLEKPTRLVAADQIKFLALIDPAENNRIGAVLKYSATGAGRINLVASLVSGSTSHFKMNASFVVTED